MFFTRLRGHAKWMFVFLALVFGIGFVGFGIGANQNASIGDLLRGSGGATDSVSVSDARKRVENNPKSAEAQRTLATSLQEDGQTDEAIVVLNRYLELAPKDQEALQELAGLHLSRANALARDAQEAQLRASYVTFGTTFSTPLKLGEGGATLGPDPIDEAISTQASAAVSEAYSAAQASYEQAKATYDRLATLAPRDPNVQLELAQAAQQGGDLDTAITAYEKFLKLAPDDPTAPIVKQQIEQLKAAQAPAPSG